MPTHRTHRILGKAITGKAIPPVDRLLDFPPLGMAHRAIHDWRGILLAGLVYGPDGAKYAAAHILADKYVDEIHRTWRRLKRL